MKKLLAVIDMQNDFITGALANKEAQAVLPAVRERMRRALREGEEIVCTRDTHGSDYLSTQEGRLLPVPHCIRGTHGWQIEESLPAAAQIIDKPAFGSLALAEKVRDGNYDEAELIGVCTDICVISNALLIKAYAPETKVRVRADCCAGITPDGHKTALEAMRACQIEIV